MAAGSADDARRQARRMSGSSRSTALSSTRARFFFRPRSNWSTAPRRETSGSWPVWTSRSDREQPGTETSSPAGLPRSTPSSTVNGQGIGGRIRGRHVHIDRPSLRLSAAPRLPPSPYRNGGLVEKNMHSRKALGPCACWDSRPSTRCDAAAADSGWYGGLSGGLTTAKINDDRIRSGLQSSGFTVTSVDKDEDSFGLKLFGGYKLNRNFAVEGGYFNLGKFGYTANTTTGSQTGSAKYQGLNLDAVGILPFTQKFSALGRVGLTYTQAKDTFSGSRRRSGPQSIEDRGQLQAGSRGSIRSHRLARTARRGGAFPHHRCDRQRAARRTCFRSAWSTTSAAAKSRAAAAATPPRRSRGSSAGARAGHRAGRGEDPAILQHSRRPVRYQPDYRSARRRGEDREGGDLHAEIPRHHGGHRGSQR